MSDLFPCNGIELYTCQPGYKTPCDCGEHEWHIDEKSEVFPVIQVAERTCANLRDTSLCELDNCDGCPLQQIQKPHETYEERASKYHALLTRIWCSIAPMSALPDDIRDDLRNAVIISNDSCQTLD